MKFTGNHHNFFFTVSHQAVSSEQEYFNWASTQIQDINVLRPLHGLYYTVLQSCVSNNVWHTLNRQAGMVKRAISYIVIIYEAEISQRQKNVFDIVAPIISSHKEKAEFEVTQCTKNKTKKSNYASVNTPSSPFISSHTSSYSECPRKNTKYAKWNTAMKRDYFKQLELPATKMNLCMWCVSFCQPRLSSKRCWNTYLKTIKKIPFPLIASIFQSKHMAEIQYHLKYESSPNREMTIQG